MKKKDLMLKLQKNLDRQKELYMSGDPNSFREIDTIEKENHKLKKQMDSTNESYKIEEKINKYLVSEGKDNNLIIYVGNKSNAVKLNVTNSGKVIILKDFNFNNKIYKKNMEFPKSLYSEVYTDYNGLDFEEQIDSIINTKNYY